MTAIVTKVCQTPTEVADRNWFIRMSASGEPIMAPPPKPMMAMPVAMPASEVDRAPFRASILTHDGNPI